jgi:effector-binding domain-containing protein
VIEKKDVPSKLYLSIKKNLTLPELKPFVQDVLPKLFPEIQALELKITGPLEFIYFGVDGNPETQFDLIIAFPINARGAESSLFEYYESEPFYCAHIDYQGSMNGIGEAWDVFVKEIVDSGLIPTGQCREVYKNWIGDDSYENVTELQMGISQE